jgi:peroxin-7
LRFFEKLPFKYTFTLGNQQCYSIRYCPQDPHFIACVSCDNFGISGAASIYILELEENDIFASKFTVNDSYRFTSTLFDIDWSPVDKHLLCTGNGDGSVAVWRYPLPRNLRVVTPFVKATEVHQKEVYSVQWEPNGNQQYHFLSASWDGTVKIWNINSGKITCLNTIVGHQSMVYAATWNPKTTGMVLSVSADKTFRLWDVNSNVALTNSPATVYASQPGQSDILCCDWNKNDPNMFILGYASGLIEIRDVRNLQKPAKSFEMAHDYAIKRVRFSPHLQYVFASVSYDMVTKVWHPTQGLIAQSKNHSEFAYGVDFDPVSPNRIVDCGWDRRVVISEFKLPDKK